MTADHPALLELRAAGWDVVSVATDFPADDFPPDARVRELHGDSPAERSDVVRHAVEVLHHKHRFELIVFSGRGGLGARSVQAKRAGLAFTDTTLAVYLDANSQRDREADLRWPSCFAEVETDYLERFAFENADVQWVPDELLAAFVKRNHWNVRGDAVRSLQGGEQDLRKSDARGGSQEPPRAYPPPSGRGAGGVGSSPPLVTVAIAHYNLGRYLPDTLATLAAQTHPDLEVIVIDDGSTEAASVDAFEALRTRHPTFTFLRQANAGIGATRNRCLELARGDYFIPVDADNLVRPDMIAKFVTAMQRNPDVSAMSCYFLAFDTDAPDLRPTSFLYAHRPAGGPHALAGIRNVYGDANAIFRTAALRAVGGYGTDRGTSCEDWEVFVKLVHAGHALGVVPDHLFYYRHRPGGFSRSTNWFANHQRVLRQFAHTGTLSPAESLAVWSALLGFHQQSEQFRHAAPPRRHRIADRVHAALGWVRRRFTSG
ncbi:GT2 family glycosyltransferase [Frigoriglobus tundricola]|uniref:GT2 family glycosyltransferase n=1 Tax=Frigoriglobus tundricola TaxID=2774151 RepID=A0A6M5YXP3_9BACT|nr:GT2 family glycosyltransferase [Frigoriglobus tundricola]